MKEYLAERKEYLAKKKEHFDAVMAKAEAEAAASAEDERVATEAADAKALEQRKQSRDDVVQKLLKDSWHDVEAHVVGMAESLAEKCGGGDEIKHMHIMRMKYNHTYMHKACAAEMAAAGDDVQKLWKDSWLDLEAD
eukprot:4189412-Karenia_brevis.AAC.1